MSTSNRLRKLKKQSSYPKSQPGQQVRPQQQKQQEEMVRQQLVIPDRQPEFETYSQLASCNPLGVASTCSLFPFSYHLIPQFNVPLGFECCPVLSLQNSEVQTMGRTMNEIPQCGSCRAFMNCYNKVEQEKYKCFLCLYENELPKGYNPDPSYCKELKSPIYQAMTAPNFYAKEPVQMAYVFLLDISGESARTRALSYAVAAIREMAVQTQLDDVLIYFFTFDQIVQEYDFSGEEVKSIIYDGTIQNQNTKVYGYCLHEIRKKLLNLLDSLEDISLNNPRKGSNFTDCFDYVYKCMKETGAKFFILQCNEAITGQPMFWEGCPATNKSVVQSKRTVVEAIPSLFETSNKTFFNKYSNYLLKYECSFTIFLFCTNFKNVKVLSDFFKLTSSEIKVYQKSVQQDLHRFYYEFAYLAGTTYLRNVHCELIISRDWYFTSIYGNFRKLNDRVSLTMPYYEPSRKLLMLVSPSKYSKMHQCLPYCAFQLITNYEYGDQRYACVSTIVQPVSSRLDKLYSGISFVNVSGVFAKMLLSGLRMQSVYRVRKQIVEEITALIKSSSKHFDGLDNLPEQIKSIAMSVLGMLKSNHSQPQLMSNSHTFDRVVAERNFLQFCGLHEITTFFNPYLFDLNKLSQQMCQQEGQFIYPPTLPLRFQSTRSGLFLLDKGISLYLFVGKHCEPELLRKVLGKPALGQDEVGAEELIMQQTSQEATQIRSLVRVLRQQKSYEWIPLYVVRCGEGSLVEKSYYLNYFEERYNEFKTFNYTLEEFLKIIME